MDDAELRMYRERLQGGYTERGQVLQSEYPDAAQDIETLLDAIEQLQRERTAERDAYAGNAGANTAWAAALKSSVEKTAPPHPAWFAELQRELTAEREAHAATMAEQSTVLANLDAVVNGASEYGRAGASIVAEYVRKTLRRAAGGEDGE